MSEYHVPVLLEECIMALDIQKNGVYVDATFGGGGHSKEILKQLGEDGSLVAFDQDEDAAKNVLEDERFHFAHSNYKYLRQFLRLYGFRRVDGILADLGVSAHQLQIAERGFSFRFDADLDMRMNQQAEKTAIDVLNDYSAEALQQVLGQYGEVRNAKTLAERIVIERQRTQIKTATQFLAIIGPLIRGNRNRYLAQVFQALRIEVNDEMNALKAFLEESQQVLEQGGKLVVISYHSLEDRIVKNFFKTGNFEGVVKKDFYGNVLKPFRMITRKPILPSEAEIRRNPKSRSAKLRIAERL